MWKTKLGRTLYGTSVGACVKQNLLYRWLTLESNAIQSCINRHRPEKPALSYIKQLTLAARLQQGSCCLLGLGGGGVAHALSVYPSSLSLCAVEYSEEVIRLSKQYFMLDSIQNLEIIHQDAYQFVEHSEHQYQHMLVDLFGANDFPKHCRTRDFFSHCLSKLLYGGVLAVNLANEAEQWPIFNLIADVFPQRTIVCPVNNAGNVVILAYNGNSVLPLLDLVQKQQKLKQLTWDSKWGYVAHGNGR